MQTDGFSGYDWLDRVAEIAHLGCMAHVCRCFMDVLNAASKPLHELRDTIAGETVERIRALYLIEQDARESGLTRDEVRGLRQERAKPLRDSLLAWLQEKKLVVAPRTLLGKAIGYARPVAQDLPLCRGRRPLYRHNRT